MPLQELFFFKFNSYLESRRRRIYVLKRTSKRKICYEKIIVSQVLYYTLLLFIRNGDFFLTRELKQIYI